MQVYLYKSTIKKYSELNISGSKSESNRYLILKAMYEGLKIINLSNSDDTKLMQEALTSKDSIIDINHAGTAMRFLTAYFASSPGKKVKITGSRRMQQRPIKTLVSALNNLGANISYLGKEGYPPLEILGQELLNDRIVIQASVSSQFISALLLVAPKLKNGLELKLEGHITSIPYIEMTLSILKKIGVKTSFKSNKIIIKPFNTDLKMTVNIESDWSSASYIYSIVSLAPIGTKISLSYFKRDSLQGDSVLQDIYKILGVKTQFNGDVLLLEKNKVNLPKYINLDLVKYPDVAQTITVSCLGLGIDCNLFGLHTLKIKESDRLLAMKTEIQKLGSEIEISNNSLSLKSSNKLNTNVTISTYDDHRMAMAFAPLALKTNLFIDGSEVVSKSYPDFWKDLKRIGIKIKING